MTSSIGLETSRRVTVTALASLNDRTMTFTGIEKIIAVVDKSNTFTGAWAVYLAADLSGVNPTANAGVTSIVTPTSSSMTLFDSNAMIPATTNTFTAVANVTDTSGAILYILPTSGGTVSRDATASLSYGVTKTWNHTVGANASILVVAIRDDSNSTTSVTYNAVAMTQGASVTAGGRTFTIYYILTPATGTHPIVINTGGANVAGASVSYLGTQTSLPFTSTTHTTTTGATTNSTTLSYVNGFGQEIVLEQISFDEMHVTPIRVGMPRHYAVTNIHSSSVDIYLDCIPETNFYLWADGHTTVTTLSGSDQPDFPESFHDILVFGVMADEYRKMEKAPFMQDAERNYEQRLSDLRMWIAKTAYHDIYQGRYTGRTFRWQRDSQILWDQ